MTRALKVAAVLIVIGMAASPAFARTWKSSRKVDSGAAKAAIKALDKSLNKAVVKRAKNSRNGFRTDGRSNASIKRVNGEWEFELELDGRERSKERSLNVAFDSQSMTLSADYASADFDLFFPVLWGVCGPRVEAVAGLGGSVTIMKKTAVPTCRFSAGVDGQIGCGLRAWRCGIGWVGGGIFAEGEVGVKPCKSGTCVNGYMEGAFGPRFKVEALCFVVFSWEERWESDPKVLATVYY